MSTQPIAFHLHAHLVIKRLASLCETVSLRHAHRRCAYNLSTEFSRAFTRFFYNIQMAIGSAECLCDIWMLLSVVWVFVLCTRRVCGMSVILSRVSHQRD